MAHNKRCEQAKSPVKRCKCACKGKYHARRRNINGEVESLDKWFEMSTPYKQGRSLEYIIARKLRDLGYSVIRAAGSHTPVDVIAGLRGEVYAIQCKKNSYIRPSEKESLIIFANNLGATPCVTIMAKGAWHVDTLDGERIV